MYVRSCLQNICNIQFDPILSSIYSSYNAKGGLGICSAMDLCLPGFLSSCYGTSESVMSLLSSSGVIGDGMSLVPWWRGLPLLWDFTGSDTLTPSNTLLLQCQTKTPWV